MFKNNVIAKIALLALSIGLSFLAPAAVKAADFAQNFQSLGCDQAVCAKYLVTPEQGVWLNVAVLPNAQGRLRPGHYGAVWAVVLIEGREVARAPLVEDQVGSHSLLFLPADFSGSFEIFFTDFNRHFYSDFGRNFQFSI